MGLILKFLSPFGVCAYVIHVPVNEVFHERESKHTQHEQPHGCPYRKGGMGRTPIQESHRVNSENDQWNRNVSSGQSFENGVLEELLCAFVLGRNVASGVLCSRLLCFLSGYNI